MTLKNLLLDGTREIAGKGCVGRYAPSPTGPLHLGNIQTAILAWLQVKLSRGKLFLRIDDLDTARSKENSVKQILDDLSWLGIQFDSAPYYQSAHLADYESGFSSLYVLQNVFACACSRSEIQNLASAPHGSGGSIIYPGTCRNSSVGPISNVQALAWRFKVDSGMVSFEDKIKGNFTQCLAKEVGDFVLKRKDGVFAYQLATVIDDIHLGITDVLRGEDLLDSTPRQIALFNALDGLIPRFWHVPLKLDEFGERMAKRNGDDSLLVLREQGVKPEEVVGLLSYELGLIGENQPLSMVELKQALLS